MRHFDINNLPPGVIMVKAQDGLPCIVLKDQPTPGDVHVNQVLTNISVAFFQDARNFVASKVFPIIPVSKQSDRYIVFDRGFFNRNEMRKRAPGTETAGIGWELDNTNTYFADVWGIHHDIPDQRRANTDSPIGNDRMATNLVTHQALINMEVQWASAFFAASTWTTDIAGVSASPSSTQAIYWNDGASTPIEDVRRGKRVVAESTGFEPNKLVLGRKTYDDLIDHPDIVDRVKYGGTNGQPAAVNRAAMASLFEVEEIHVMNGIQNTAGEGVANSHSFIGSSRSALLCYAPPQAGIEIPSAGYTFSWTGFLGASEMGSRIKRFRMEPLSSDRVEIEQAFDQKKIAADLGYFFSNIVEA